VWGKYWYAEVEKSTGWRPYQPTAIELPDRLRALCDECQPHYDLLHKHRMK